MAHPRAVPLSAPAGDREFRSFQNLRDRPLVIAGNGPSASLPPHDRLPANPVVFRMNWFFLESHYHFGDHVDAWFCAIANAALERHLRQEIYERRYRVDRVCSPMRVPAFRDGEAWFSQLYDLDLEELDHWSVIARNPRLGRFCMSRPLPTQGMQALAFALQVGFREIYLCGIDLYESKEARYGYVIPEAARNGLLQKDLKPGYEDKHSLERDLTFLEASLHEFPSAEVYNLGESVNLDRLLERAPVRSDEQGRMNDGALPKLGQPKDRVVVELPAAGSQVTSTVVRAPADARLWAERGGRKCAYITLVAGDFHHGARALANSLRRVSEIPLLALCTPTADRTRLAASGIHCIDVPDIVNPNQLRASTQRFAATYSKLNVFRLSFLDRLVYLDGDTVVLRNIDDLFDGQGLAAVPDAGINRPGDIFNSGVFAVNPSQELFDDMLSQVTDLQSYDDGDQGFLNSYFTDWHRLPLTYNTTKRLYSHHADLFSPEDIRVLHYVGVKPWQPQAHPHRYAELDWQWLEFLSTYELRELVVDMRQAASDGIPAEYSRGSLLRRAQARMRDQDFEGAEQLLRKEWPGDASSSALERELATALRKQEKYPEALPHLENARVKNPTSKAIAAELEELRIVLHELAAANGKGRRQLRGLASGLRRH